MTKYIPISSVCIIACRSNDIQSLETLVLPNHLEWKRMEHRFILVITHAYNDGTTKKYFKTNPSKRKLKFYDYVVDAYTQEIRKILGVSNKTEVYPLDVGDTLARLCSEEIKSETDRKEIVTTKDRVLSALRKSIVSHKGERLKSALVDLEVIIKHYREDEIQHITDEIKGLKSKIKDKNQLITRTERAIEQLNGDDSEQNEILSETEELKKISNQFSRLLFSCISNFSNQIKQYILYESLYKTNSNGYYLKDKGQKLFSFMRTDITDMVNDYIQKLNKLIRQADINVTLNTTQIQTEADFFIFQEQNSLYPSKKGLFSKKEKVFLDNIKAICDTIQYNINEHLNSYVNNCISEVKNLINDKQNRINYIRFSISQQEQKCKRYKSEIRSYKKDIEKLQNLKDEIERKREQDEQTLSMYLNYAKQAYKEQRNDVIQRINRSKNADDKMLLILLLGLLDKDYQIVTGGINENSDKYAITK